MTSSYINTNDQDDDVDEFHRDDTPIRFAGPPPLAPVSGDYGQSIAAASNTTNNNSTVRQSGRLKIKRARMSSGTGAPATTTNTTSTTTTNNNNLATPPPHVQNKTPIPMLALNVPNTPPSSAKLVIAPPDRPVKEKSTSAINWSKETLLLASKKAKKAPATKSKKIIAPAPVPVVTNDNTITTIPTTKKSTSSKSNAKRQRTNATAAAAATTTTTTTTTAPPDNGISTLSHLTTIAKSLRAPTKTAMRHIDASFDETLKKTIRESPVPDWWEYEERERIRKLKSNIQQVLGSIPKYLFRGYASDIAKRIGLDPNYVWELPKVDIVPSSIPPEDLSSRGNDMYIFPKSRVNVPGPCNIILLKSYEKTEAKFAKPKIGGGIPNGWRVDYRPKMLLTSSDIVYKSDIVELALGTADRPQHVSWRAALGKLDDLLKQDGLSLQFIVLSPIGKAALGKALNIQARSIEMEEITHRAMSFSRMQLLPQPFRLKASLLTVFASEQRYKQVTTPESALKLLKLGLQESTIIVRGFAVGAPIISRFLASVHDVETLISTFPGADELADAFRSLESTESIRNEIIRQLTNKLRLGQNFNEVETKLTMGNHTLALAGLVDRCVAFGSRHVKFGVDCAVEILFHYLSSSPESREEELKQLLDEDQNRLISNQAWSYEDVGVNAYIKGTFPGTVNEISQRALCYDKLRHIGPETTKATMKPWILEIIERVAKGRPWDTAGLVVRSNKPRYRGMERPPVPGHHVYNQWYFQ
jgi:hypothetical protein